MYMALARSWMPQPVMVAHFMRKRKAVYVTMTATIAAFGKAKSSLANLPVFVVKVTMTKQAHCSNMLRDQNF